jgi:hypothetical protein
MEKQEKVGAYVIVSIVQNHRPEVQDLLLRNGVSLPNDTSNLDASRVITELLKKSKNFKNEFMKLLSSENVLENLSSDTEFSNATGTIDFSAYNVPSTFNGTVQPLYATPTPTPTVDATATQPKTGFTLDKGLALASQGLNAFLQLSQNKTDQKLAEASIAQTHSANTYTPDTSTTEVKGLSTGWIVGLSILGIGIVGGGIWYFNKNKK